MSNEHLVMLGLGIQFAGQATWMTACDLKSRWRMPLYALGMTVAVIGGVIWLPVVVRTWTGHG